MNCLNARNQQLLYFALAMAACLLAFLGQQARADAPRNWGVLTLEEFIQQVKTGNTGIQGALKSGEGGEERAEEGALLLAPTVFLNTALTSDARPAQVPILTYSSQLTETTSLGVSKLTDFGMQAKLYYSLTYLNWVNPALSPFITFSPGAQASPAIPASFYTATTLELTQSLWSNGFGRSTRANQHAIEAQALASSHASRFQAQGSLVDAETAYWRLAVARQTVGVEQGILERARKIYEWNERRARLQLADQTDALQAEASLKLRELDLQTAQDVERNAARAFNTARNVEGDEVPEQLAPVTPELLDSMPTPKKAPMREDVKAAQEQQRAAVSNAEISLERDSPTLEIFGSLSLNGVTNPLSGQPGNLGDAIARSFSWNMPTETVGLRFSAPIDLGTLKGSRQGWRLERDAAELAYQRKLFEQDQGWKDLTDRLAQARRRFTLSRTVESTQETKLNHEKQRLQQGRTTTFQVLAFEQDYASSVITRIQAEADVLTLLAQMKLYGDLQ